MLYGEQSGALIILSPLTSTVYSAFKSSVQQTIFFVVSKKNILWFKCQECAYYGFQLSSVAQSCPTLCDPMNRSMPGLPVRHQLPEFTQTHVR